VSEREDYPAGAPCWVDTLQPDPAAAAGFYGPLFGWEFDDPIAMPEGMQGPYLAARSGGRLVAGIGQAPDAAPAAVWSTYVRVEAIEETLARAQAAGGTVLAGPREAGGEGRLAVLADDTGVAFSIWQAGDRKGAQLVNEPGTWAMSSLHAPSVERAQAFYGAVFGWELEPAPGTPFALWRLPGYNTGEPEQPVPHDVVAVITPADPAGGVPPHWAINFRVEDVDATAEQAIGLGGTVLMAPMETPGFRNAVLADPQGGVVAVSAPVG
jgi:uncharacterized protein